jgi:hypothetical protein
VGTIAFFLLQTGGLEPTPTAAVSVEDTESGRTVTYISEGAAIELRIVTPNGTMLGTLDTVGERLTVSDASNFTVVGVGEDSEAVIRIVTTTE